jgi:hypothetical protein
MRAVARTAGVARLTLHTKPGIMPPSAKPAFHAMPMPIARISARTITF